MLADEALAIERRSGLGGSDAGPILGVSPWRTAVDVYLEKTGRLPAARVSDAMRFGQLLEAMIAGEFAKRKSVQVARVNRMLRHKEHPELIGHVDRRVLHENALVECKLVGRRDPALWGDAGSGDIPEHYKLQVYHYLAIGTFTYAFVPVYFAGDHDFRIYELAPDLALQASLVAVETAFWRDYVLAGVMPPASCLADAKKKWPTALARPVAATAPIAQACIRMAELTGEIAVRDEQADGLKTSVMDFMAEADTLIYNGEIIATWKPVKGYTRRESYVEPGRRFALKYAKENDDG